MRHHVDERAVAGEHRRGQERHARVLHAAIGKRRRQHQHEALLRSLNTAEAAHGVQWSYVVLVGLSLFQLWPYRRIRLIQRPPKATQTSIWQNLVAGLRYSWSNPGLWTALVLAGMVNMVAFPLQFGLLPVFARDVFQRRGRSAVSRCVQRYADRVSGPP